MKRLLLIFASTSLAMFANAQETYDNANIATEDLNGTARYVGMGGAMDALGADLSTIGTNPAGIGLFRHSTANVSFGLTSQQDAKSFAGHDKTNINFDQVGFVYSRRSGRNSFINIAFNYHKSRNFNQILSAAGTLSNASQNKLSCLKGYGRYGFDEVVKEGNDWIGKSDYGNGYEESAAYSQVDNLYYNVMNLVSNGTDQDGNAISNYRYINATGYNFNRTSKGYIGEYDFNISGNANDRIYWGLTFGISDVHYKGYSQYDETLNGDGEATLIDEHKITGTGFNVKAGVIFRPIETSPLRIGLSVSTPTWYDLTSTNHTYLSYSVNEESNAGSIPNSYDFKLYTPWKFGLSLGTTVSNCLALGAVYEYADYGALDPRINTGSGYDEWGYYYDNSETDYNMKKHTEATLKAVHTLKLGMEYKPDDNFAIRLGYNYISPMYNKDGIKNSTIESPGTYYSSSTDYTNWKSTNRITCGFGYYYKNFSADLAYQYSTQNGEFCPFMSIYDEKNTAESNTCDIAKVSNKRHQILLTLGYHF